MIRDEKITLDYGSGGKKTSSLIEEMIVPAFDSAALSELGDGAILELPHTEKWTCSDEVGHGRDHELPHTEEETDATRVVFSTDSFVVNPYFFPGGDIGKLAVCGTVNDISVSGGKPRYLSLALIIEEGFPTADLQKIIDSAARTARAAGVAIVTGDTKVVDRGKCDGIYINTSGIGSLRHPGLSPARLRPGDKVIVSGTMGDHGTAVMLARNEDLVSGNIESDCAPLNSLTEALRPLGEDLRVMRDPTRGGLITTLNEFVEGTSLTIEIDESTVPVSGAVASACDILGLDPLYAANEGKLIAVVSPEKADEALQLIKADPLGRDAAIIGTVTQKADTSYKGGANAAGETDGAGRAQARDTFARAGKVIVHTAFGGSRIAGKLTGAQLPRIC